MKHTQTTAEHGHAPHEPHESGWLMTAPLICSHPFNRGGFIGVPYALGSLVFDHPVNYLEKKTRAALASEAPEQAPAEIHWLSPPPSPHDGAPQHLYSTASSEAIHLRRKSTKSA